MSGWISVKDRLPKEDGPILVWSGRLEDVPTCAAARAAQVAQLIKMVQE